MIQGHEAISNLVREAWNPPEGSVPVQLPPPAFQELQGRFESYVPKKELCLSFPVQAKHTNPMGRLQGGFMAAAIDAAMGFLSYMTAGRPTTTLDLHINYLRGVEPPEIIHVTATIVGRGFGTIYQEATVTNAKGKTVARATSQVLIVRTQE